MTGRPPGTSLPPLNPPFPLPALRTSALAAPPVRSRTTASHCASGATPCGGGVRRSQPRRGRAGTAPPGGGEGGAGCGSRGKCGQWWGFPPSKALGLSVLSSPLNAVPNNGRGSVWGLRSDNGVSEAPCECISSHSLSRCPVRFVTPRPMCVRGGRHGKEQVHEGGKAS